MKKALFFGIGNRDLQAVFPQGDVVRRKSIKLNGLMCRVTVISQHRA
jgi:hypothetical protein